VKTKPRFNNNSKDSRLRGRPKKWRSYVQTDINKGNIITWKDRLVNGADWEKLILEAKVRIGLLKIFQFNIGKVFLFKFWGQISMYADQL
jgi:hypothetical protein